MSGYSPAFMETGPQPRRLHTARNGLATNSGKRSRRAPYGLAGRCHPRNALRRSAVVSRWPQLFTNDDPRRNSILDPPSPTGGYEWMSSQRGSRSRGIKLGMVALGYGGEIRGQGVYMHYAIIVSSFRLDKIELYVLYSLFYTRFSLISSIN